MMNSSILFSTFVIIGAVYAEYLCVTRFIKMFLKGRVIDIVFQILNPIILIALFYVTNLYMNMGQFRLYFVLAFVFGFLLYKITFYKMLDKLHKLIYNKLTKLKALKYTKVGKFLLK